MNPSALFIHKENILSVPKPNQGSDNIFYIIIPYIFRKINNFFINSHKQRTPKKGEAEASPFWGILLFKSESLYAVGRNRYFCKAVKYSLFAAPEFGAVKLVGCLKVGKVKLYSAVLFSCVE